MKTIIIYASRYGTAKECAERLAKELKGSVECVSAVNASSVELNRYDRIILGGGIYAGSLNAVFKQYIDQKTGEMLQKRIGLFLCGIPASPAEEERSFAANFPQRLLQSAVVKSHFGGRVLFTKMKGLSKLLIGFVLKKQTGEKVSTRTDYDALRLDAISAFAQTFDKATIKGTKEEKNVE